MMIGARLRKLREEKRLSQGDLEERTGLTRASISRIENAHTCPSLETLERLAAALEIPLYQLFHEGDEPPAKMPHLAERLSIEKLGGNEAAEKELRFFEKVRRIVSRIDENDRDDFPWPPTGASPAHGWGQVASWLRAKREGARRAVK